VESNYRNVLSLAVTLDMAIISHLTTRFALLVSRRDFAREERLDTGMKVTGFGMCC
jgi:hypothetical protein